MTGSASTRVYARALFEAAGSAAATVATELGSLVDSAAAEQATWEALVAPEVSSIARLAAIDSISADASPVSRNFLRVLVDNGRLAELPQVVAEFVEIVKAAQNELDVRITTAVELPAELRSKLEERLSSSTGSTVRLHASVDPDIIGGLVVQHGDTLIDTSLRSRLDDLRLQLRHSGRGTHG